MDRERYKCGGSTSNSLERLFSRAIKTIREVVSTTSQLLQLSLALFSHSKLYTIEWNPFWRSICSAIFDWVRELMMIKCKNSKVSQMALQMLLQKRFHSITTYYKPLNSWQWSNSGFLLSGSNSLYQPLVTLPMMQRRPNPTELRSMDSYFQMLCRFQKIKWKVPPLSLPCTKKSPRPKKLLYYVNLIRAC